MELDTLFYRKQKYANGITVENKPTGLIVRKRHIPIRFIPAKKGEPYSGFFVSADGKRLHYQRRVKLFPESPKIPSPPSYTVHNEVSLARGGIEYDMTSRGSLSSIRDDGGAKIFFYFAIDDSKRMRVALEHLQKRGNYRVLQNEFDDDSVMNVEAWADIADTEECAFLSFLGPQQSLPIYGISADMILNSVVKSCAYQSAIRSEYGSPYNAELDAACQSVFSLIQKKHGFRVNRTAQYIYDNYVVQDWDKRECILTQVLRVRERHSEQTKLKYDELFNSLIDEGKYLPKWKSEFELYKLVKKTFPDAVYQYHSEFLGLQSLDIFIPALQTGIEYQGKQHYEAVDFFGGEEALKATEERDDLKRQKCKQAKVRLIEWRYDEPISQAILTRKIREEA